MSTKKPEKAKQRLIYQALKCVHTFAKRSMTRLLRVVFIIQRPERLAKAGFVLPTVVMVTLVVTLLTGAILVRSFDRAQSASNYRVNQEVLNASLPSLDRAREKIIALFEDPQIPKGTPGEPVISDIFNQPRFRLGDEVPLQVAFDIDGDGSILTRASTPPPVLDDEEIITTAWRFPVDTDNNGKFDSFTLYSVLFRNPPVDAGGAFNRSRNPLESRALPLDEGATGGVCAAASGTSASLVGNKGWFFSGDQIKRSFFVYVATVPIKDLSDASLIPANGAFSSAVNDIGNYEVNSKVNLGFSALEYQQDQARIPIKNNAVVYQDDMDITSGKPFRLNGRLFTNSNLFITEFNADGPIEFYQVSSPNSCFYDPENAKVVVGGNVNYGTIEGLVGNRNPVRTDLYNGQGVAPIDTESLSQANKSVDNDSDETAYNTQAYELRIAALVNEAASILNPQTNGPQEVREDININGLDAPDAFDRYFRKRTRRVPFREVTSGSPGPLPSPLVRGMDTTSPNNEGLRPHEEWVYPFNPLVGGALNEDVADNSVGAGYSELTLNFDGNRLLPQATEFTQQENQDAGRERYIGDRVQIGNNLPELRWNGNAWVGETARQPIRRNGADTRWDEPDIGPRQRLTRVETLDDLGDIGRNGFWERASQTVPINPLTGEGGLRIVTGAGIYLPPNPGSTSITLPSVTFNRSTPPNVVVYSDTMPVIPGADTAANPPVYPTDPADPSYNPSYPTALTVPKWFTAYPQDKASLPNFLPFLRMRASVVYHYLEDDGDLTTPAEPIACVDNYYDPTDRITAFRDNGSGIDRNGMVYAPPGSRTGAEDNYLRYLASQVYPNGRVVNPLLREAMLDPANRSIAEQSAVDAAICGLRIFETIAPGSLPGITGLTAGENPGGYELKNGVIREVSFLDSRQIKSIDADPSLNPTADAVADGSLTAPLNQLTGQYQLPLEQRQPLEVRTTVIDLQRLRLDGSNINGVPGGAGAGGFQEYLFPNSGIIYATRNDALPDNSNRGEDVNGNGVLDTGEDTNGNNLLDSQTRVSATDFLLDPTRRPRGIMLINGERLARDLNYREVEKGLTLVSDLPVYIKGEFNPHENSAGTRAQEEFTDDLITATYGNFYTRTTLNTAFACRQGDSRLPGNGADCDDEWRPANILSDAVTLLSEGFQEGFRVDGDFDLRNNRTDTVGNVDGDSNGIDDNLNIQTAAEVRRARLLNGFLNNNYVTNGLSQRFADDLYANGDYEDSSGTTIRYDNDGNTDSDPALEQLPHGSSYFNNFVTPVQRRAIGREYVMEICRKLPVSDCEPGDWVVGYDLNSDGDLDDPIDWFDVDRDGITGTDPDDIEANIQVNQLVAVLQSVHTDPPYTTLYPAGTVDPFTASGAGSFDPTLLGAGTTSRQPYLREDDLDLNGVFDTSEDTNGNLRRDDDRRYARRVAFLRHSPVTPPPPTPTPPINLTLAFPGTVPDSQDVLDHLVLINGAPVPIGIQGSDCTGSCSLAADAADAADGSLNFYPYNNNFQVDFGGLVTRTFSVWGGSSNNRPRLRGNTLWFQTSRYTSVGTAPDPNWGLSRPLDYLQTEDANNDGFFDPAREDYDPVNPLNGVFNLLNVDEFIDEDQNGNNILDGAESDINFNGIADSTLGKQPILVPVLQIQYPEWPVSSGTAPNPGDNVRRSGTGARLREPDNQGTKAERTWWIQPASDDTIFNMVMGTGDSPARPQITGALPNRGEFNGGLSNLPRFLENWTNPDNGNVTEANIRGSLIQL
nr:hormogonium polysaccharide biosynthesis protein HpsA [Leptolyngbyaceae cyanobacterium MO_188.B28]